MELREEEHDQDEKRLLNGKRLPRFSDVSNRTANDDIGDALDNLFLHLNVGPFIGRLREPYLRYVRLAKTFNARSEEGIFKIKDHETYDRISQIVLRSSSVFNFFLPNHQPAGLLASNNLYAPEFQILTSSTAITSLNPYMEMIEKGFGDKPDCPSAMRLNLEEEIDLKDAWHRHTNRSKRAEHS